MPLPRIRYALRLIGWNVLLLMGILTLIAVVGEVYLRTTRPFVRNHASFRFVPRIGSVLEPNVEIRWTNMLDYRTISRTNSLGFLDREPPSPELAATSW